MNYARPSEQDTGRYCRCDIHVMYDTVCMMYVMILVNLKETTYLYLLPFDDLDSGCLNECTR